MNSINFLGLIFDQRRSWNNHIDSLVDKCRKRINILKSASASKWGVDKEIILILYRSPFCLILYGYDIYDSADKTYKAKLD